MSKILHLFSLVAILLNISATPKPAEPAKPVVEAPEETAMVFLGDKEENDEVIPWKYERMLTWEDFQSEPIRGTEVVATTSTTLGLSYQVKDGELVYSITCNFSKVKSWGSMRTDYILAHEQGHFDITELIARQLHESLQSYEINRLTFKQDITRIYNEAVKSKEAMQEAYDSETNHSRNRQKQYEWLDYIDKLLVQTEHLEFYP